jgi:uncharacterized protein
MSYIDLAELDAGRFRGFRRANHFGDVAVSLEHSVRNYVQTQTGDRPSGPIYLLTHLRRLGYAMNPVSFYYCYDADGETLETIVAEVHNTPWGETHCYLIPFSQEVQKRGSKFAKEFHVSPFMPMDQEYVWRFTCPGEKLVVHMENFAGDDCVFDATLVLQRHPLTRIEMLKTLVEYPLMTHKVIASIYWQALRLWRKGVPYHPKSPLGGKG